MLSTQLQFDRNPRVEIDAIQRAPERGLGIVDAIAVAADRAGEPRRSPPPPVRQILERLRVGLGRIWMIDSLQNLPWRGAARAGDHAGLRDALTQPLGAQPL